MVPTPPFRRPFVLLCLGLASLVASWLVGCAGTSETACQPPGNPSGDCESPTDSSRPGYSSAPPCSHVVDCQNPLDREYWRVYVDLDRPGDPPLAFLLPRPDGSSCLPEPFREMPRINTVPLGMALEAARCLHGGLRFEAVGPPDAGDGWRVEPWPMPGDVAAVCEAEPSLTVGALRPSCEDCPVKAILDGLGGGVACPAVARRMEEAEATALADAMNQLYGVTSP